MLVVFQYNNGKEAQMQEHYAKILQKLKRGTYRALSPAAPAPIAKGEESETPPTESDTDELEQLRAEADEKGIEYHHRAGPAKLRELLGK